VRVNLALQGRHIVAFVTFEGEKMEFRFNRNLSTSYIASLLPKLVMDRKFDERIRARAV